jgi:hypothetical protein
MNIIKHSDGIYFIEEQYLNYSGDYRIDGIEIKDIHTALPLQFDHIPVIEKINKKQLVDYVENKETGEKIDNESFEKQSKDLYLANEDDVWANIDEEFAFRKFVNQWERVYKAVVEYNPVEITVLYENVKSDFPDIVAIYTLEENVKSELFEWRPDFQEYVTEIAKKYKFDNVGIDISYGNTKGRKYSFSRKNSIEYMTCNGSYASLLYEDRFFKIKIRRGTYSELIEYRANAISKIDSYFEREYQKTNESKVNNIGALISKLESISNSIKNIDPKSKTRIYKNRAITTINDLIIEFSK